MTNWIKKLLLLGAVLLVLLAVATWWLMGHTDRLIRSAIETYGSEMTQATVKVESVKFSGDQIVIRGLMVGNPKGFKTAHAFKVDQIDVALDLATFTQDVIRVHHVRIDAPDVIYEKGDAMTNFDAIQKNVAAYAADVSARLPISDASKTEHSPKTDAGKGKRLIVDDLSIRQIHAQASAAFMNGKTIALTVPDLQVSHIGQAKGGIPPGELGQEIVNLLRQRLSAAFSFDQVLKAVGEVQSSTSKALKSLIGK